MTHDEWAAGLQRRYQAVWAATRAADRLILAGIAGMLEATPKSAVERDMDLEDAAAAWAELVDWWRQQPPRR